MPKGISAERGHRWFAAAYERRGRRQEQTEYARDTRTRVAGEAIGRVLEIGAGTGFNFPYYSDDASVAATEPDPEMLRRAEPRARKHGIELRRHRLNASPSRTTRSTWWSPRVCSARWTSP